MNSSSRSSTSLSSEQSEISLNQSMISLDQSMMHFQSTQGTPFAQQFNYHLQDLTVVRREGPMKPDGQLCVHLPNISCIEVDFNRRETVEVFRSRIQKIIGEKMNINNYYLVSPHGSIVDSSTLDDYYVTPGTDILLIRKGIKNRTKLANRRYWLESRKSREKGELRSKIAQTSLSRHRITPYAYTSIQKE
ncbi:hypothetical protein TRFO_11480 [Tritrichomonas foetus]|uniref:Ubiquitin-like domain-containing protein n=1 Tax=Tritrichomonas foetus TaxID=1144522 RepID=A0A1J4J990_9EUKA|nr:hypothetical protein TRFO_11480 [Tritrichomonas foetus]|eukprot:OHS93989.1 hypothetical protein TRFO_11480 [Tritrichomonas foetus]